MAIIADEASFWRNEATTNPDSEILAAARPMLATTSGPLIIVSSPYARRGEVWNAYKRDYGPNGDRLILVAKADSRTLNPSLPEKIVARAYERDSAAASAEYGAEFRTDIESFVSREAIDAATVPGRIELPPVAGKSYVAFVDPSGGASDSMTLGIAHAEGDVAILDAVRETRPPFSPDSVVGDFVDLLNRYGIHEVTGDCWGGEFVRERFNSVATYRVSEKSKSELYKEFLPLINSKRVEFFDIPRLHAQLGGLQRRTARGGRESIDHAPNAHDDMINAAAGALVIAAGLGGADDFDIGTFMKAFGPTGNVRAFNPTGNYTGRDFDMCADRGWPSGASRSRRYQRDVAPVQRTPIASFHGSGFVAERDGDDLHIYHFSGETVPTGTRRRATETGEPAR